MPLTQDPARALHAAYRPDPATPAHAPADTPAALPAHTPAESAFGLDAAARPRVSTAASSAASRLPAAPPSSG